jgi:hypothetical protein
MSKFQGMMHLLDVDHPEIKKREYNGNVKPFHEQNVAIIKLNLPDGQNGRPKLNPTCAKCQFCTVIQTQGKINEMGCGGYMCAGKDGLKEADISKGVNLREPRTIIIGDGEAYACTNREETNHGRFFLTDAPVNCTSMVPKAEEKSKQ